jgi:HD-GYP domain-containing protein (c-di-GMP phosphodiesterase class II)
MRDVSLIHSLSFPIERYQDVLSAEAIPAVRIGNPATTPMSIILVDAQIAAEGFVASSDHRFAYLGVGIAGQADWLTDDRIYLHLPADPSSPMLITAVRRAYEHLRERARNDELESRLKQREQELEEVNKVGIAMSTIRDHDSLLNMILKKSRELSRADAGSLYLLDEADGDGKSLRWKLAQNDSIDVSFEERVLPITKKSMAGYVALTGETLVIEDAYQLPAGAEYSINTSFDLENGYLTKSLLVFPMTNHVGEIIGVLQLINRKKVGAPARLTAADVPDQVISFDEHTIKLVRSLAGQAAVALENNILYDSIERLFEGFVTASVTAIEQRDPTTSGHSFRVADLTVELAKLVDSVDEGPFRGISFTPDQLKELRYASLLHDFGKVGVREKVLVKEKKLYPLEIDIIRGRFDFMVKAAEARAQKAKLEYLQSRGFDGFEEYSLRVDGEMRLEIEKLEEEYRFVVHSNEPTVLPEGEFAHLLALGDREFENVRGERQKILTPEEIKILSIRKGNLDPREREEIESHVTHTFRFLSKIPWTRDLRGVPEIAYAHHEKINGRGYPRKLAASDIPVQSKMMTVSDIYDALTANDRPYKKAVQTDRALDILRMETNEGLLEKPLVDLFIQSKVYERAGVVRT